MENPTSKHRKPATETQQGRGKSSSPERADGEDYRKASGRDHPAESEHDHQRQKLNVESAKMANAPPRSLRLVTKRRID
ncbi:MAG: hypothetical protein EON61_00360 [Alphaproteobacteria bacterium]|nr:MAG: hypothetical protein EON61_00360 [Alphaproteobacteria bacterium]